MTRIVKYRIAIIFTIVLTIAMIIYGRYQLGLTSNSFSYDAFASWTWKTPVWERNRYTSKEPGISTEWMHLQTYNFTINNLDKCTSVEIYVVVVVSSAPHNFKQREFVRKTWGNATAINGKNIRTVFILGATSSHRTQQKLLQENEVHGDIVQQEFIDSYNNLTLKTIAGLQWAYQYCQQAKFVFKTDDDVLVLYKNLIPYLNSLSINQAKLLYVGDIHIHTRPIRNITDKWHLTRREYPQATLPPYQGGSGYTLSMLALKKVLDASKDIKLINIEDAFIGICAKKAGLSALSYIGFSGYWYEYSYCRYQKLITTHGWKLHDRKMIWKQVMSPDIIPTACPPFDKLMQYYDHTEEEVWEAMERNDWP